MDLSNEVLYAIIGQLTAKLWTIKVGGQKKWSVKPKMSSIRRITLGKFWSSGDPGSIPGRGKLCTPAVPQPMNQNKWLVLQLKISSISVWSQKPKCVE